MASEEVCDCLGDGLGTLDVQQVPDPVDGSLLDVGDRVAEELGDVDPQRRGVAAKHGQHRLANGRRVLGAEGPLGERGQLDAEDRVGILDRLGNGSGDALIEQLPAPRPLEAAHGTEEHGEGALVIPTGVGLEHRGRRSEKRLTAGHREEGQLEQHERGDSFGFVERQLGGDGRAAGVADDMSPGDPQVIEQRGGVGGVVGHTHRAGGVRAAHPPPLVVADQLVALGE